MNRSTTILLTHKRMTIICSMEEHAAGIFLGSSPVRREGGRHLT
ncbi:MAG: hypothetical protein ACOCYO_07300 [Bacteroidota bacterium]